MGNCAGRNKLVKCDSTRVKEEPTPEKSEVKAEGKSAGSGGVQPGWVAFDDDRNSNQVEPKASEVGKQNGMNSKEDKTGDGEGHTGKKVEKEPQQNSQQASDGTGKSVSPGGQKTESGLQNKGPQVDDLAISEKAKVKEGETKTYVEVEWKGKSSDDEEEEGPEKSASKSIKVLHEVRNGRVVATETTDLGGRTELGGKPNEDELKEKKAQVLKKKMDIFLKSIGPLEKVIDFEENIFLDDLMNKVVLLEEVKISGREINGLIAFYGDEKPSKVVVMSTTDSWKSKTEEEAIPCSSTETLSLQRFFFSLFVPFTKSIEFAVKCFLENNVHWDNNNSSNYFVENSKEKEGPGKLVWQFVTPKDLMFTNYVLSRSVCVKNVTVLGEKTSICVATKKCLGTPPVVRYTLDNWQSFSDVSSSRASEVPSQSGYEEYKVELAVPKGSHLIFAVNWKHDGREEWDNNLGKNYEVVI